MAVLRFPNPASDVPTFVEVFRILQKHLKKPSFGHDDIVRVFIKNGQASSCGAVARLEKPHEPSVGFLFLKGKTGKLRSSEQKRYVVGNPSIRVHKIDSVSKLQKTSLSTE
jgi:hypothetical protein